MKFTIAYYLLLIYATVILNPIIPLAEDSVMHCFAEAYHVATVHAKYGNNHLEKQEAGTSDESNSNTKNVLKEDNNTSVHIAVIEPAFDLDTRNIKSLRFIQPNTSLRNIFLNIVIPPPKSSYKNV